VAPAPRPDRRRVARRHGRPAETLPRSPTGRAQTGRPARRIERGLHLARVL